MSLFDEDIVTRDLRQRMMISIGLPAHVKFEIRMGDEVVEKSYGDCMDMCFEVDNQIDGMYLCDILKQLYNLITDLLKENELS